MGVEREEEEEEEEEEEVGFALAPPVVDADLLAVDTCDRSDWLEDGALDPSSSCISCTTRTPPPSMTTMPPVASIMMFLSVTSRWIMPT